MNIEDFIQSFRDNGGCQKGYDPGEVPEFSEEKVKQMLKDLLVLAADKAKVQYHQSRAEVTVDRESILNILEE